VTERIESIEIQPMRGHSRGKWWGTLEDVVESDEDAEYWALFGITHRGNKHCLGEFGSKEAALSASLGMSRIPPPTPTETRQRNPIRKIIQLEVVSGNDNPPMIELIVLCDDGTVWHRGMGIRSGAGLIDDRWEQISQDGLRFQ